MAQEIKNLLPLILKNQDSWKLKLLSSWQNIFGPLSDKVSLEKIHEDTLILGVHDSCWLQELYLLSSMLLKTINETLDMPRIKHLRFKTVGIKRVTQVKHFKKKERSNKAVLLTAKENHALRHIKDEQLANALKNFLIRCYQEQ